MEGLATVRNPNLACNTPENVGADSPGTRTLEMVRAEIKEWQDTSDKSYLKLGRLLQEFRSLCKYSEWSEWLKDNVDFSICKAQRLIRVASWVDSNKAPVLHLGFTKVYILSRLIDEDFERFRESNPIEEISKMSKQDLQDAVRNYLLEKAGKGASTVKATTHQHSNGSTEDDLRKRFNKIQSDVSELASLIGTTDSGVHDTFVTELCELCQSIIQQLSPEDIEDD